MIDKCKGMDCTYCPPVSMEHSLECEAQHAAAVAGGHFVKLPLTKHEALPEPVARVIMVHQPLRINQNGSWKLPPQLEALLLHKVDNGETLYTADQMHAYAARQCAAKDVEIEKLRAAGQMALEALDSVAGKGKLCNTAITALTTALKGTP
jgi:hypothetical protein